MITQSAKNRIQRKQNPGKFHLPFRLGRRNGVGRGKIWRGVEISRKIKVGCINFECNARGFSLFVKDFVSDGETETFYLKMVLLIYILRKIIYEFSDCPNYVLHIFSWILYFIKEIVFRILMPIHQPLYLF